MNIGYHLCSHKMNMIMTFCSFFLFYQVVAPKKAALEEAERKLNATMAELNGKKAALQKV